MPDKDKKTSSLPIILAIVFIMVSVLETAIIFNVAGIKNTLSGVPFVGNLINGPELQAKAEIEKQTASLNKKEAELKTKETALANKEAQLQQREKTVSEKEKQLSQKEQDLVARETELNSKQMALSDMAKLYENMEPKQAAAILSNLNNNGLVVDIIKAMKSDKAAEVLAQMDAKLAAEITKMMQP